MMKKKVLNFLFNYCQNFGKADVGVESANLDFGNLIEHIINLQNYSLEFKDYILSNRKLIPYISNYTFINIIVNSNLSKTKKLELLFRTDILEKMSIYYFSEALGSLCESYEDYHRFLIDEKISKKISITTILENTTLKSEELKKLLFDEEIYDQIDDLTLGKILQQSKMDFETRKSILFDEKLFSKLNEDIIAQIVTCKYLTSQQRFELINDERIFKALVGSNIVTIYRVNSVLESPDVPIMDKVAIVRDERFMKYIDDDVLQQIMSNPDLPLETANEILFNKKIFYRLIGIILILFMVIKDLINTTNMNIFKDYMKKIHI